MALGPNAVQQLIATGVSLDIDCSNFGPAAIEGFVRSARPGQTIRLYCPNLGPAAIMNVATLARPGITIAI